MPFSLLPKMRADSLTDIKPDLFWERNIKLVMLDFDNTIVPYTSDEPTALVLAWLTWVKQCHVHVCVVSNSHNDRVPKFCEKYGLHCITHAKKPFSRGIRQCLAKFNVQPAEAVLIGDQIFTDTLGANCCGVQSILIQAIDNHNFWLKLRHGLEMPFILLAHKRRIHK